ncbi:threonine dehydratase [Paraburkholderia sp. BL6665CI2N2]|uniref:hydroxyectoine utilization dehydratase EutB n=1 Tax=Paraburkholderia sp. BL6665CI2N2 TaxID=1938806 RepID=UPI001064CD03|nr:hydroxyectoine utilization dehydratase EutB [Paraburkholderia sp. BL6665CI2N2]TDY17090.1 threonine dehydratase [Paraburkholderia sp. BL6665CI2N2]
MIDLKDIEKARYRLKGHIETTVLASSFQLSEVTGVSVGLKLEHHQKTGSFKFRGATNAIMALSADERSRGVVAASTGNHGRALAFAARRAGARAVICMSRLVPQNKILEIRRLGADVRIVGNSQDDAQEEVDRLVGENGLVMVPPFDHPDIVAGQGTIGIEIVEAMPDVAAVLVPLSGGGLAAGVAAAVKGLRPATRMIGVTMDRGAAMKVSLDCARPVKVEEFSSLADSLGGGIGLENTITFPMCHALLDDVVLVTEQEIAAGIRHAYEHEREIVEGAGAVGIAAVLARKVTSKGPLAIVLSGRNIDMGLHKNVLNGWNSVQGEANS